MRMLIQFRLLSLYLDIISIIEVSISVCRDELWLMRYLTVLELPLLS